MPHSAASRAPRRSSATSQRLVRGRDERLDRAARVLQRAVGGVEDLDAVRRLAQAAGAAADEGQLLRDAVVQLAGEPAALALDRRPRARSRMRARISSSTPAKQRDPAGDAQRVAEVDVLRAERREQRVVELREARRARPRPRPSAAAARRAVRAAGEADGGGHERGGDRRSARSPAARAGRRPASRRAPRSRPTGERARRPRPAHRRRSCAAYSQLPRGRVRGDREHDACPRGCRPSRSAPRAATRRRRRSCRRRRARWRPGRPVPRSATDGRRASAGRTGAAAARRSRPPAAIHRFRARPVSDGASKDMRSHGTATTVNETAAAPTAANDTVGSAGFRAGPCSICSTLRTSEPGGVVPEAINPAQGAVSTVASGAQYAQRVRRTMNLKSVFRALRRFAGAEFADRRKRRAIDQYIRPVLAQSRYNADQKGSATSSRRPRLRGRMSRGRGVCLMYEPGLRSTLVACSRLAQR